MEAQPASTPVPIVTIPRFNLNLSPPLRWGEWLSIALFMSVSFALSFTLLFRVMAAIWFDEPSRELVPFLPLMMTFSVAAIGMRLPEVIPSLRPFERPLFLVGFMLTSGVLIRLLVFPQLAPADWSWLDSFADITNMTAERPHAELGMIAMSAIAWSLGIIIARSANNYALQRSLFIRCFIVDIVILVFGLGLAQNADRLSEQVALLLPSFAFSNLILLSLVRIAELRGRMRLTGGGDRRALLIWRAVTIGIAFITLIFVFGLTAIFYTGSYGAFLQAVDNVWNAIVTALIVFIGLITYPFFFVLAMLTQNARQNPPANLPPPLTQTAKILNQGQEHAIYSGVLVIVAIIIVLLAFWRISRLLTRQVGDDYEEERASLPRGGGSRLTSRSPSIAFDATDIPQPGTARAAYREILRVAHRAGLPRAANETPAEYERRFNDALGEPTRSLMQETTTGYEAERYGATQLPAPRLTFIQQAAQTIKGALAQFKRSNRPRRVAK